MDVDGAGGATWQEFGHQLRAGPTLTVNADGRRRSDWTVLDTSAWSPAPAVIYTVTRDDGTTTTVVGEALSGPTATDMAVPEGATPHLPGGCGGRRRRDGAQRPVSVTGVALNQPPAVVEILAPQTLPIATGAVSVEVSGAFSDAESDALTYTYAVVSSAPAVVSASISRVDADADAALGGHGDDHG